MNSIQPQATPPPQTASKLASLRLSLFIARRYVRSKHSLNFITVITGISIGGIMLGVAALIIVMSLFNGFQSLIDRFLIGFDPHLRISVVNSAANSASSNTSVQWLRADDSLQKLITTALQPLGASYIAPVASGKMVCVNGRSMQPFQLIGIEQSKVDIVSGLRKTLVTGEFRLESEENSNLVPLVMGAALSDNLRLVVGDTVQLLSPNAIEAAITQAVPPKMVRGVIVGVFQSNTKEYDATQAYTSLAAARRLLKLPTDDFAAQYVDVRLENVQLSTNGKNLLQAALGTGFRVETWFDLHRELYNIMRFERLAAFCVLLIIVLVAVFNIFASLSMTVAEKRAEIGMLKALGARSSLIVTIFFSHSFLVGVTGTVLGAVLGVGVCWGQMNFGWIALDTTRYVIPILPLLVEWSDVAVVCVIALTLSLLSGFAPAREAGKIRSALALLRKERV
ncbi:MAG: ABC transporter permease [Candidatus Kapabacteria bacterium]|jgi:lipoprotein-releasing system permease protein|nr:ABC transporter permease [Candidatus Kapabacteria bacterium]